MQQFANSNSAQRPSGDCGAALGLSLGAKYARRAREQIPTRRRWSQRARSALPPPAPAGDQWPAAQKCNGIVASPPALELPRRCRRRPFISPEEASSNCRALLAHYNSIGALERSFGRRGDARKQLRAHLRPARGSAGQPERTHERLRLSRAPISAIVVTLSRNPR